MEAFLQTVEPLVTSMTKGKSIYLVAGEKMTLARCNE